MRDSGDNAPVGQVPVIDFSGNPRIANIIIDRGAVEAEAPPASPVGPIITAVSPANGSTTVFEGPIGGGFVGTPLTFSVSGGVSPGVTKLECSKTEGDLAFGIGSSGETVGVGDSITPIDVGFDSITSEPQTGTITCAVIRDLAGTSYLRFNFVAVPPGGPAVFDSDPNAFPDPASTVNLTPAIPAIVGSDVVPATVKLKNIAGYGSSDLEIDCFPSGGSDPQILITPTLVDPIKISPQGAFDVSFDCDTTTPGSFAADYSCIYDLDDATNPWTVDGEAQFTVECDVRPPPETHVEPTPPSGTPTTQLIEPNGSANFDFSFAEVSPDPDLPADANLLDCSIVDDTYGAVSIQSPAFPGGPYPIVNGSPVAVQVQGTDNSAQQLHTATLHCEYTDTDHQCKQAEGLVDQPQGPGAPGCGVAEFPLELRVMDEAKFRVIKDFSDDENGPANPTEVEVTISCFTGLPLVQSQTISQTKDVVFVVDDFDRGELDCEITEDTSVPELAGYTPSYHAGGPDGTVMDNEGGCNFYDLEGGSQFTCDIVNDADPVEVEIEKLWVIEGEGGDAVDQHFKLTLYCDAFIADADYCHSTSTVESPAGPGYSYECRKKFYGEGSDDFFADVTPQWPSSHCWVDEKVYDDSVEIQNDCGDLTISHGQGDSCLITNTVFFEGIPTLSQYGLALLALFMLGVGLLGFRRYS